MGIPPMHLEEHGHDAHDTEQAMRKIRLTYLRTGESVEMEMLDEEAPTVCQHVWDSLPIERKVVNGMYSGAEVYMLLEKPKELPMENICQLPLPGELFYFFD